MRISNVKNIAFTSTSAIYGEAKIIPTPENYGPLYPISTYGASKLAAESLISSYCHMYGMKSWIFRLANVVGTNQTHGVAVDFINKLKSDPQKLLILGDGSQSKSYLYIEDCIEAIMFAINNSDDVVNTFNIGSENTVTVRDIANIVVELLNLYNVELVYTNSKRGWIGDIPQMMLSIDKIKNLGWEPTFDSEESIRRSVSGLVKNNFI